MSRDFERDLREWGRRPPGTRPETAATRVVARLQSRPTTFAFRRLVAAAAVVIVLLVGAFWLAPQIGEEPVATIHTPTLDDNVVLWWVDPETPVYFVLTPPNCK